RPLAFSGDLSPSVIQNTGGPFASPDATEPLLYGPIPDAVAGVTHIEPRRNDEVGPVQRRTGRNGPRGLIHKIEILCTTKGASTRYFGDKVTAICRTPINTA